MKRTALQDRVLPDYTHNEELANSISHFVGAGFGLAVLAVFPFVAAHRENTVGLIGSVVFGISLLLLYLASGIYHGLPRDTYIKKVFQVIDHCTIFLLIAGSYTAFVLATIGRAEPVTAFWMLSIVWTAAIVGIVLNAIDLERYAVFSMCCYLMMGWLIVVKYRLLASLMTRPALILLITGGVLYTVGAVFYMLGEKRRYTHFVFHIFTVLGSLAHIACAALCVL